MDQLENTIYMDNALKHIYSMIENIVYDKIESVNMTQAINLLYHEFETRISKEENITTNFLIIAFDLFDKLENILQTEIDISIKFKKIFKSLITTSKKYHSAQANGKYFDKKQQEKQEFISSSKITSLSEEYMQNNHCRTAVTSILFPCKSTGNMEINHRDRPVFKIQTAKVFMNWMEKNKENPYLSRIEKKILNKISGLDDYQTSNWFVNSRRRILPKLFKRENNE